VPWQPQPVDCDDSLAWPALDTIGVAGSVLLLADASSPTNEGSVVVGSAALVAGIAFAGSAIHGFQVSHACSAARAEWEEAHRPVLVGPAVCDDLRAQYRAEADPQKRFELVKQIRAYCRERPSAAPPPVPQ